MARIVVAGATGRIGRMLSKAWAMDPPGGAEIIWTGRRAEGPVPEAAVTCRLTDPARFAALCQGADAVLDLAGPTRVTRPEDHAAHLALFEAVARAVSCPVLTMSSAAVYGPGVSHPEYGSRMARGPYAAAKCAVEDAVRARPGATALRLCNVAGADALLGGVGRGPVRLDLFDDGATPRRSYLGGRSLGDLLAQLLARSIADGLPPVLNLCASETVEMGDLLDRAGIDWTPEPAPPSAIRELTVSAALLGSLVDVPLGTGTVEKVIAEWREIAP